jgi:tetratricopeptide (TPR) repeat protein
MALRRLVRVHQKIALAWAAVALAAGPGARAQDSLPPPQAPAPADLKRASELVRAGTFAEAEAVLRELQEGHPDDPAVLLMRGEVLLALGRFQDALPVLRRCSEVAPQRPRVNFQIGTALQKSGEVEAALQAYSKELECNQDPKVRMMAHLNRSMLLERTKSWALAADELEAAVRLGPERPEVYGDIASLRLQAGQLALAREALDRGAAAGFRSAPHYRSLGAHQLEAKSYDDAIAAFSKALEIDPALAEAELGLGSALDQAGREAEAVGRFERYLDLRPNAPEAAELSKRIRKVRGR